MKVNLMLQTPDQMETRPLKWKDSIVPGYYIREDGYLTNGNGKAYSRWKINGRDYSYIHMDGKGWNLRIDYMVAYTYIGMYEDAIRLIHLDGDPENCHHRNLMWYRKLDIYEKYKAWAIIESDGSIQEEWRHCLLEHNSTLCYEVSNLGFIRDKTKTPIPIYENHGYRIFCYPDGKNPNKTHTKTVSRAVAEAFIPNPDDLPLVKHLDGNSGNDAVLNLMWRQDNILMNPMDNRLGVQYSTTQVHAVCRLLVDRVPHVQIAMMTGVDRKTISDIYRKKYWTSISSQYDLPGKKWIKERKEQINQMIIQGMKGAEIFRELGIEYDQSAISMYERARRELKSAGKIA